MEEVLGGLFEMAARAAAAPWAALSSHRKARRDRTRRRVSWLTKLAATAVVLQTLPPIVFLALIERAIWQLANDDLFVFIGLILFLPVTMFVVAAVSCLLGGAALCAIGLLEGNAAARWAAIIASVAAVALGGALSNLDQAWLGYSLAMVGGVVVVLLVLPPAAEDFAPATAPSSPTSSSPRSSS